MNESSTSGRNHESEKNTDHKFNFNYQITKFFIGNNKLTIIVLILLIAAGTISTLLLKTTGFPSPDINLSIIQTVYPGASSKTVNDEITKPLENSIKSLEGIESYSSRSQNNVSIITLTLEENDAIESTRTKIDSAIKSTLLPDGAGDPITIKPNVGGPNYIFSVFSPSKEETYNISQTFIDGLNNIDETSEVTQTNELKKVVLITLDQQKVEDFGISKDLISFQLSNLGTELPVVSNIDIKNGSNEPSRSAIQTKLNGTSIDDIKNLNFVSTPVPASNLNANPRTPNLTQAAPSPIPTLYKFSDFAEIKFDFRYEDKQQLATVVSEENQKEIIFPNVIVIKTLKNVDQAAYKNEVDNIIKDINGVKFVNGAEIVELEKNSNYIVENYNVNILNQDQVDEVIGGLIGSKLDITEPFGNIGYLLGGIQLVFLVMLAFVSWRAAIVAATAIPLSLVFTTIYLYLIGETLNTLVLFSLVLVIGLVVDPALVILESIQRKVDVGFKGKQAALEAVKDVGTGLFLATLTNIIVFLPFGLISGIIGKIFSYIPLTVIPATIGSYIVPLVFLSWFGGLILKPNKNKTSSEEENLWPIARSLISLNKWLLKSSVFLRAFIIIICVIIPVALSGYLISSGQLKIVQFASDDNSQFLVVSGEFRSLTSQEDRDAGTKKVLEILSKEDDIQQVYPFGQGVDYFVELKPKSERDTTSQKLSQKLTDKLLDEVGEKSQRPVFFDITVASEQNGPPSSAFQVSIAINTEDLDLLQKSAKDVEKQLELVCLNEDRTVKIDQNCGGQRIVEKVDNGFNGKENNIIEVDLDRNKLALYGLTSERSPLLSANITSILKEQFDLNDSRNQPKLKTSQNEYDIVLETTRKSPESIEEIKNLVVTKDQTGKDIKLSDVSVITQTSPSATIRRVNGKTVGIVGARLVEGKNDQAVAASVTTAITEFYSKDEYSKSKDLGLNEQSIGEFSEGSSASGAKSFQDLLITLVAAIVLSYLVLAIFFRSLLQPLVIIYTIPLTFIGMFPGLAYFGGGQLGFLEIIGVIILIGVVENVAIFLIDGARQYVSKGMSQDDAISLSSGIRFRPVLLTTLTAIASLAPLAILSVFYRSISVVIIFGLLSSGFLSLITTPILYSFFNWLPVAFAKQKWYNKLIFLAPITIFPILVLIFAGLQKLITGQINLGDLTELINPSFGGMILISITSLFTFREKTVRVIKTPIIIENKGPKKTDETNVPK